MIQAVQRSPEHHGVTVVHDRWHLLDHRKHGMQRSLEGDGRRQVERSALAHKGLPQRTRREVLEQGKQRADARKKAGLW